VENVHVDYKDTRQIKRYEDQTAVPLTSTAASDLFQFLLLDYKPPLMPDVPLIYAASPFVNGGLRKLKVETTSNAGAGRDGVSVLTIEGVVLPHSFQAICSTLQELQGDDCVAWWTSLPNSDRLNAAASTVDRSKCAVTTPKLRCDRGKSFVTVATPLACTVARRCRDDAL
jgi:hypothetical protein